MKVSTNSIIKKASFLDGGGEAADLISSIDWSQTSLGAIEWWPQSLRTTLSIILRSKFPMFLFWGHDLLCFYNDAYRPSLGNNGKHPSAMGNKAIEVWPEIWNSIKPLIDNVFAGGEANWSEDQLLPIYRNGKLEDVYWTFSYSPVEDESGEIAGVFVTCSETTEKVKLVNRLEEDQKKFYNMIEQAPMGITIFKGLDFIVESANKTYLELVDRKAEDFINKPLFESLPEVKDAVKPLLENVYKTGVSYHATEFPVQLFRYGKTSTAFFNFTYQPLYENAEVNGIIVIANDVTNLVTAKYGVEESEKKFRDAVTNSPIAIGIFRGEDFIIEEANNTLLNKLWRRELKDVLGKKLLEAFPELNDQQYPALLRKVYETGISHTQSEAMAYVESWDGVSKFFLDFEYAPLFDSEGKVSGIMITVNDVTEKVEARTKIADAEERMRIATDAGHLAPFELNMITGEIHASQRFNEVFGSPELIPRSEGISMILPEDQLIREKALNNALNDPNGKLHYDVRLKWKDGTIHWARMDAKFFFDESGKPLRLLGTMKEITDEKNAVQKVEDSEKHFRNLIQESPMPKALLNGRNYVVEIANDAILQLWNKTNDVLGKPLLEALPELRTQPYIEILDEVYNTGISYKGNERAAYIDTGNGEVKKLYLNLIFKRLNSYPKPGYDILITGYDVTQQVLARRKIEESENELQKINQRLEIALEAGRLGSYELDLATGMMNCTSQCKANYGLQPDAVFNFDDLLKAIIPIHKEHMLAAVDKAIKEHSVYNSEYTVAWPDESLHWIRASGKATYNEDGVATKIVGVTLDITAGKLALQQMAESEQRLNMALEYTNTGSWDLDLKTLKVIYTPRLAEIFGYPGDAIITHPQMRSHINEEDRKSIVEKAFSQAIKSGIYFYEARIVRPDKSQRWIRTRGKILYDNDNIPVRMVGTIMDITEEKSEQQRKDEFMGIVTHELKTPLTSVKGFAQFLHERALTINDKTSAILLEKMVGQVNKLNLLVQDLLDITRMENGKLKFQNIEFNFKELVLEIVEQLSITTTKNIVIKNTDWNGSIIGDRERIGQILINLLTNAIKYSPDADTVIISVELSNEQVICSVTDFGIGIAKENQPYIFDRFYREDEAYSSTFPGLGLGLYISAEIIKRQEGKIWIQSEKGKGSVFSFSLPLNK